MVESIIRVAITAVMIFALTEIAKRSAFMAAIVASSPIATIGACLWLYSEKQPISHITNFAWQTTLLLPPSIIFFIGFPLALKKGMALSIAMPLFVGIMFIAYAAYIFTLQRFGFRFT